jgi:secondary thiamine-phosphate synthase enzyme
MGEIKFNTEYIVLSTKGSIDIIDITDELKKLLNRSKISDGILTVFVPGATGAVATIENEEGLIKDTKQMFLELVKENKNYYHDLSHAVGNATSHLRATLIGPSLTIPITDGELTLGVWQQVVFIEFDTRPRDRKLVVKIVGE